MLNDRTVNKVLIVEDNPGDLIIIKDYLRQSLPVVEFLHANKFAEAAIILNNESSYFRPDVILLDLTLPDLSGEELILNVLKLCNDIPVIVLTGYTDVSFSIKSMSLGISDYVLKDDLNASLIFKSVLFSIERKKHTNQLINSQKRYENLFQSSPLPTWVVSAADRKILDVNLAASEKYGYSRNEFLKMNFDEITQQSDNAEADLVPVTYANNESGRGDLPPFLNPNTGQYKLCNLQSKAGSVFTVELRRKLIQLRDDLKSELYIASDVTEKRRYIEQIERKNAILNQIAWIQSHEVRAPLSRILGLVYLLNSVTEEKIDLVEIRALISYLEESANEMDDIVKKIIYKANEIENRASDV
ncbi:MAG: response regulator [Balneolales bacterium]|nr:response regulator [Balneolales bacterium]